ncbi:MAG: hypothetical protein AAF490_02190 [Chloroflexota bacterium]
MSAKVDQFQAVPVNVNNVVTAVEEIKKAVDLTETARQVYRWWLRGVEMNKAFEANKWATVQKYHYPY